MKGEKEIDGERGRKRESEGDVRGERRIKERESLLEEERKAQGRGGTI